MLVAFFCPFHPDRLRGPGNNRGTSEQASDGPRLAALGTTEQGESGGQFRSRASKKLFPQRLRSYFVSRSAHNDGVRLVRDDIVQVFLGSKWEAAAPVDTLRTVMNPLLSILIGAALPLPPGCSFLYWLRLFYGLLSPIQSCLVSIPRAFICHGREGDLPGLIPGNRHLAIRWSAQMADAA
jgi:hypothetical protein